MRREFPHTWSQDSKFPDSMETVSHSYPMCSHKRKCQSLLTNIPSKQDLARRPYLQKVNIPEIDGNIELLIGMNASKIMEPWEIINSQGEGPYAVKTLVSG